jgi:hypothetical protein
MPIFAWLGAGAFLLAVWSWWIWHVCREPGLTGMERVIWSLVCIAIPWWGFHMFQREHGRPTGIWRYFRD